MSQPMVANLDRKTLVPVPIRVESQQYFSKPNPQLVSSPSGGKYTEVNEGIVPRNTMRFTSLQCLMS